MFSELVNEQLNGMERTETSVLNDMLNTEDVDLRDKIVTLIDLVSGGIETVRVTFFNGGLVINYEFVFLDWECCDFSP